MNQVSLLQGLLNYTLVAGKSTVLRLFNDSSEIISSADHIGTTVLWPDGSKVLISWSKDEYVTIMNSSIGPSIAVKVAGKFLPFVGTYYFKTQIMGKRGEILATYLSDRIELLPTKDLRAVVYRVWSGTASKPGEIDQGIV